MISPSPLGVPPGSVPLPSALHRSQVALDQLLDLVSWWLGMAQLLVTRSAAMRLRIHMNPSTVRFEHLEDRGSYPLAIHPMKGLSERRGTEGSEVER